MHKIVSTWARCGAIKAILVPVANGLLQLKIQYPLTIVYIPLKLWGWLPHDVL